MMTLGQLPYKAIVLNSFLHMISALVLSVIQNFLVICTDVEKTQQAKHHCTVVSLDKLSGGVTIRRYLETITDILH